MRKLYIALGIALLLSGALEAQLEYKDVAPIFFSRCTQCHHENQHAPSMMTYAQILPLTFSIQNNLESGKMPPWSPDTLYSRFSHERIITEAEKNAIISWIDDGAVLGDTSNLPPQPVYSDYQLIGEPDLVLQIPAYTSPAGSADAYSCFALPTGLTEDRIIRAFEIVPGNVSIVHHVLVSIDTAGTTTDDLSGTCFNIPGDIGIGGYAPGAGPTVFPGQAPLKSGIRIKAGSKIDLQIHYPTGTAGQEDSTQIRFYFYPPGETGVRPIYNSTPLQNWVLFIPANSTATFTDDYPNSGSLTAPLSIFSCFPHSHEVCTQISNYAYSGTDTIPLIKINNWDFNWQGYYTFHNLVKVPQGYKLFSKHFYDNTTNNPFNPHTPPQNVFAGTSTSDEMLFDSFMYFYYEPGDENINIDSMLAQDPLLNPNVAGIVNHTKQNKTVFVYPNPAAGKINISTTKSSKYVASVKTLTGQQLLKTEEFTDNTSINSGNIAEGVYLVEITDLISNSITTKKIVVAH